MIPWLVKPPEQPDDDENTIKMTIMQPVPDNWQAIADRFGFEVVPMMYSQTEASGRSRGSSTRRAANRMIGSRASIRTTSSRRSRA